MPFCSAIGAPNLNRSISVKLHFRSNDQAPSKSCRPGRAQAPHGRMLVAGGVDGQASDAVARKLAERGLFLSDGDFYALTVVERLNRGGLVRAGLACYTTMDEVERLIESVQLIRGR